MNDKLAVGAVVLAFVMLISIVIVGMFLYVHWPSSGGITILPA